ncbi:hypothetical protein B0H14DRAFT_2855251, partial [Mycena olivaceomarginata]
SRARYFHVRGTVFPWVLLTFVIPVARRPWCKCISGRGGHARTRSRRPPRTVPAVRGERPRAGPSPIPFPQSFFVGVGDIGQGECTVVRVLDPEQDVVVEWELVVEEYRASGVRTSGRGLASGRCRRATWVCRNARGRG